MYRKITAALFACIVFCLVSGCNDSNEKNNTKPVSSEQKVEQVTQKTEVPVSIQDKIKIEDVQKFSIPQDYRMPSFGLKFKVTNNTNKPISGVQLYIRVNSQFGDKLLNLSCDIDDDIPVNGSIIYNRNKREGWDTNRYINEEVKAVMTPSDKLRFTFIVNKIIYKDGFVESNY